MNTNRLRTVFATAAVFMSPLAVHAELIEPVRPFVQRVEASLRSLPAERKVVLNGVVDYIVQHAEQGADVKMIFICTHNSRRSHLSQIWCQTAAAYYSVPRVETYSGGTEATACNIRTVRALRRAGLSVVTASRGDNPIYLIQFSDVYPPIRAYSKVYSADGNPTSGFAAMMCCSDADKQCPSVAGADARFPLHYEDPKVADNTPDEATCYDARSFQIAQEMFFIMSEASRQINQSAEPSDAQETSAQSVLKSTANPRSP